MLVYVVFYFNISLFQLYFSYTDTVSVATDLPKKIGNYVNVASLNKRMRCHKTYFIMTHLVVVIKYYVIITL